MGLWDKLRELGSQPTHQKSEEPDEAILDDEGEYDEEEDVRDLDPLMVRAFETYRERLFFDFLDLLSRSGYFSQPECRQVIGQGNVVEVYFDYYLRPAFGLGMKASGNSEPVQTSLSELADQVRPEVQRVFKDWSEIQTTQLETIFSQLLQTAFRYGRKQAADLEE